MTGVWSDTEVLLSIKIRPNRNAYGRRPLRRQLPKTAPFVHKLGAYTMSSVGDHYIRFPHFIITVLKPVLL